MSIVTSLDEEALPSQQPPSYRTQTYLILLTVVLVGLYFLCAFLPAVQFGLYRLSSWHITTGGVVPGSYGRFGGLGTILLVATVMLLLLPTLGLTLLMVIFGHPHLSSEQRLFWSILIVELIVVLLLSYPITDATIQYIFYG
jgi:hypothetical protein